MRKFIMAALGFDIIWDAVKIGVGIGRLWNFIIEVVDYRIDRALWDADWAWSNDRRYHQ